MAVKIYEIYEYLKYVKSKTENMKKKFSIKLDNNISVKIYEHMVSLSNMSFSADYFNNSSYTQNNSILFMHGGMLIGHSTDVIYHLLTETNLLSDFLNEELYFIKSTQYNLAPYDILVDIYKTNSICYNESIRMHCNINLLNELNYMHLDKNIFDKQLQESLNDF